MKKIFNLLIFSFISVSLFACMKSSSQKTMMLGGTEYDSKYVRSGYYFDKASLSDATLLEMLGKVEVIEKPDSLGKVELPDFSSFVLTNNMINEVDDEQIEAEIEKERDKETTFSPVKVKRDAKMTDRVTIDFKGYVDGEAFDGGEMTDYPLVLGSGAFIPGFEEAVVGHPAGKKFSIYVTFPEYYDEKLAGKDAVFDITIKNIEESNTPELNDEFVKKHTKNNSKNVVEYKDEIKKRIEGRNEFLNNQDLTYQLFDKLINDGKFYPTEEALAWQFSLVINQICAQAEQSGMALSDVFNANGMSVNDSYNEIKNSIPDIIKEQMLMENIINKYNVSVTESEVKDWFSNMFSAMGYGVDISYDDYIKYVGKENMFESTKQYKALTAALKDCTIVFEEDED